MLFRCIYDAMETPILWQIQNFNNDKEIKIDKKEVIAILVINNKLSLIHLCNISNTWKLTRHHHFSEFTNKILAFNLRTG